jgi:hypothetical protein
MKSLGNQISPRVDIGRGVLTYDHGQQQLKEDKSPLRNRNRGEGLENEAKGLELGLSGFIPSRAKLGLGRSFMVGAGMGSSVRMEPRRFALRRVQMFHCNGVKLWPPPGPVAAWDRPSSEPEP